MRGPWIVIQERTVRRENIPRVINVKIHHAQPKRKVNTGHCITMVVNGNELSLREDLAMLFKFFDSVGLLGRVNEPANLDNRLVMRGFHEADSIVGWKHPRLLSRV